MKTPHLAFLIPTLDAIGGAERQVLLLARVFAGRGWRVTVLTLSGRGSPAEMGAVDLRIEFRTLAMRKGWIDPRGWAAYVRWHKQEGPEIVHAHLPHATWFARWIRLLAPVRVLVDTIHTSSTGTLGRRLGYRVSQALADRTTCVSRAVADAAQKAGIVRPENLTVLANGIPLPPECSRLERIPEHPANSRPFYWIAVGRLSKVKDYPTLLHAFAKLPATARLRIAGSGPEEAHLRSLTSQLGIEERVKFLGFQANIQPWLDRSDAFVLSSLWEGLPVSVLEAAASWLPVVATAGAGTAEALIPGVTGLLVPPADASALAGAMLRIMEMSPDQRRQMGSTGREFVSANFALEAIATRWESLYYDLLEANPNPRRHRAKRSLPNIRV
jgi:glycosyltransferase involved in cell wall biosynthesis